MNSNDKRARGETNWAAMGRIVLKAALLFVVINLLFALLQPMEYLGRISLYNWLLQGRDRLPYGENPAESYNLNLNNIPAMIASHSVSRPKAEDEFRIIVIGDSGTWGWLQDNEDTLAGQINDQDYRIADGRRAVAYNLGYPIMALSKDLLILEEALEHDPDLIIWPVTLESFSREKQLVHPLLLENPNRVRSMIEELNLDLPADDPAFHDRSFLEETIYGRRRDLADLLRLQLYGFSWDATGIDQALPEEINLRASDLDADLSWGEFESQTAFTSEELALDSLKAGIALAGDVPVLIVNEPIFISQGENHEIRYNAWYPRWAYDQYRELLRHQADSQGWHYQDLWDGIAPEHFTDSPVHLTAEGTAEVVRQLHPFLQSLMSDSP